VKIAILGAAGNMGGWLIRYFSKLGHTLIAFDPNIKELSSFPDVEITDDCRSAVSNAELVIVTVPMELTAEVINDVAPFMKKNAILCEIASVKTRVIEALRVLPEHSVRPLSIHPLFGPGAKSLNKRIAVIPLLDQKQEKQLVETLFPDSEVIVVDAEQHDRIMAVTLSLPYFVNMAVAAVLKKEDITVLKQLSGTTFALQLILAASIMSHSSEFHVALQNENAHTLSILNEFLVSVELGIKQLTDNATESFEQSYNEIKETFGKGVNLQEKYEEMYRILEVLQTSPRMELDP